MKTTLATILIGLALCVSAGAQISDRGSMVNQKACYDQAYQYAKDQVGHSSYTYTVVSSHFDANKRICFVWLRGIWAFAKIVRQEQSLVDAFEGSNFAEMMSETPEGTSIDDSSVVYFRAPTEFSNEQLKHLNKNDADRLFRSYAMTLGFLK